MKKKQELNEDVAREMNKYLDDESIEEILIRNKKRFHYYVMFNQNQMKSDIEVLDLGARAYNCLKRAGCSTVGDLVRRFGTKEDATSKGQLKNLRNLGATTADEILVKLFYYQFLVLPDDKKREYMHDIKVSNN